MIVTAEAEQLNLGEPGAVVADRDRNRAVDRDRIGRARHQVVGFGPDQRQQVVAHAAVGEHDHRCRPDQVGWMEPELVGAKLVDQRGRLEIVEVDRFATIDLNPIAKPRAGIDCPQVIRQVIVDGQRIRVPVIGHQQQVFDAGVSDVQRVDR